MREKDLYVQQAEGEQPLQILPRLSFPKVEDSLQSKPLVEDLLVQQGAVSPASGQMPSPLFNFEGTLNRNGVLPPDPNGDIGRDHYVQWVNLSLAVWRIDRGAQTAERIFEANGNQIWSGFGGPCELTNHGDPIVLYDHLADRWMISQFSVSGPYYQCIAVSQGPDPTGGWYRYAFKLSDTKMNDYPHFGVWPDGYYLTVNQYSGNVWAGAGALVFEREKMLAGLPARMVFFDLYSVNRDFGGMLPADLDGPPPPVGVPNYLIEVDDSTWLGPQDALRLWEFHVDWANPDRSTLGLNGNPNQVLPVAGFTPLCSSTPNCIPQPDTLSRLDAIGDRLMYRVQYRYFGPYATLVSNHTVDAGGGRAGLRWFELRQAGESWSVYQQGTYAGGLGDGDHRWMGSAAMDKVGNIAIGYSASGSSRYPSIHYAGRLAGDPLGSLPIGESTLIAGSGSQLSSSGRWGDYSMLGVDPVDDCTFWFTSEYYLQTSLSGWRTRIGAFVLPACLAQGTGRLQGQVTETGTGSPLPGVQVEAGGFSTRTDASGFYQLFNLPAGRYPVSARSYGYSAASAETEIITNTTATLDFNLAPLPKMTLSGTVKDGSGQGWPLYARLQIDAPGSSRTLFTDPQSGGYQVEVVQDLEYTFQVSAVIPGYSPVTTVYTPTQASPPLDFSLLIEDSTCLAPGYEAGSGCEPRQGGLLLGNLYDANTGAGLNGATVAGASPLARATSQATPEDPHVDEGFYTLFSPLTGALLFTASQENYGTVTQEILLSPGQVTRQNFSLPAGRLSVDPGRLEVTLTTLQQNRYRLTLANTGGIPVTFSLAEVDAPLPALQPTGPFAASTRRTSPKRLHALDARAVYEYLPPAVEGLAAGQLIRSWGTGLAAPWGISLDLQTGSLWVASAAAGGGDDQVHRFSPDGAPTGEAVELSSLQSVFPADLAYNPVSGTFWQALAGGSNCLVEIDPAVPGLTGARICPGFANSPRGLAFNPLDGSFYSGSWTDGILYHFDAAGTILDSVATGLNLAGMAFNPATRHLFVLSNSAQGYDLYVLDTAQGYAVTGGFDVPGLEAYQQAGLEMDCAGHLWLANQATGQILEVDSGETSACAWSDIPWLSIGSNSASLPPGGIKKILLITSPFWGNSGAPRAHLVIRSDSPYGEIRIPVTAEQIFQFALPYVAKYK